MTNQPTLSDIYKLNKRGRAAADGKSNEILVAKWLPVDDLKLVKQGKMMARELMYADMKELGFEPGTYHCKVGFNPNVTVDNMPIIYWWALIPKDKVDTTKVMTLEKQREEADGKHEN